MREIVKLPCARSSGYRARDCQVAVMVMVVMVVPATVPVVVMMLGELQAFGR